MQTVNNALRIINRAFGFIGMSFVISILYILFIGFITGKDTSGSGASFMHLDFIGNTYFSSTSDNEGLLGGIYRIVTLPLSTFIMLGTYSFLTSIIYDTVSGNLKTDFQTENKFRKKLVIFGSFIMLVSLAILALNNFQL